MGTSQKHSSPVSKKHPDKVTNRFIPLCHGGGVARFARVASVAGTFGRVQVRLQMHRQYVVAFVAILQQSDANTRLLVVRAGVFSLVLSMGPIDILDVLNPLDGIQELLLRVCVGFERGMFVELANGERAQSLGFFCAIFNLSERRESKMNRRVSAIAHSHCRPCALWIVGLTVPYIPNVSPATVSQEKY